MLSVTFTSATAPEIPDTVMFEGYGVAAPLSGIAIGVVLLNVACACDGRAEAPSISKPARADTVGGSHMARADAGLRVPGPLLREKNDFIEFLQFRMLPL